MHVYFTYSNITFYMLCFLAYYETLRCLESKSLGGCRCLGHLALALIVLVLALEFVA